MESLGGWPSGHNRGEAAKVPLGAPSGAKHVSAQAGRAYSLVQCDRALPTMSGAAVRVGTARFNRRAG